jgi:VanZ family protein
MKPYHEKLFNVWLILIAILFASSLLTMTAIFHVLYIDILFHMIIYSILAYIPMIAFCKRKTAILLSLAVAPLSFLFELIHSTVSGWSFEYSDALANNIGIMAGMTAGIFVRLKNHYKKEAAITK